MGSSLLRGRRCGMLLCTQHSGPGGAERTEQDVLEEAAFPSGLGGGFAFKAAKYKHLKCMGGE